MKLDNESKIKTYGWVCYVLGVLAVQALRQVDSAVAAGAVVSLFVLGINVFGKLVSRWIR